MKGSQTPALAVVKGCSRRQLSPGMKSSGGFDGKLTDSQQQRQQASGTLPSALLRVQGAPGLPRGMGRGDSAAGRLRRQNGQR